MHIKRVNCLCNSIHRLMEDNSSDEKEIEDKEDENSDLDVDSESLKIMIMMTNILWKLSQPYENSIYRKNLPAGIQGFLVKTTASSRHK